KISCCNLTSQIMSDTSASCAQFIWNHHPRFSEGWFSDRSSLVSSQLLRQCMIACAPQPLPAGGTIFFALLFRFSNVPCTMRCYVRHTGLHCWYCLLLAQFAQSHHQTKNMLIECLLRSVLLSERLLCSLLLAPYRW